jgi:hypothetical protein
MVAHSPTPPFHEPIGFLEVEKVELGKSTVPHHSILRTAYQQAPHTTRPSGQWIEAPASPQSTPHVAPVAQVTAQPPAHLMSHDVPASHDTVLAAPRLNLQFAVVLQVAVELAPAFRSHFEAPSQTMVL